MLSPKGPGLGGRSEMAFGAGNNLVQRRHKTPVRVLIAVPDVVTGEFITEQLKKRAPYFRAKVLIGESSTIPREVCTFDPHVILLSDELDGGSQEGFTVLRELRRSKANTAVVMLLKRPDPRGVISAFRLGARGIVYRSHSLKSLPKCLQTVCEGQLWLGNEDLEYIVDWLGRPDSATITAADGSALLTNREQDVVWLVADGMRNREIAKSLHLTENSVRNYLYRIFEKLGVSSRAELMLYAFSQFGVELRSRGLRGEHEMVVPRSETSN
jgi:two-component system nitrate/nitrite response regulator NarL